MSIFTLVLVFFVSLALTVFTVGLSIKVAHRWKVYDYPNMLRKTQKHPVPKLGGVAVALALLVVTLVFLGLTSRGHDLALALGVLAPAALMSTLGFIDDQRHLDPYVRLAVQAGLAALVWATGTRVDFTGLALLDFLLLVIWVMLIVNGINLLDNSDGLAASTALVSALGAAAVATISGQSLVPILAVAVAGAALGFLWHNWFPARVYLGDSGAYFLGFLLAVVVVEVSPAAAPAWAGAAIALLLVALPLADLVFVVVRRLRSGIHPFTAGRDHLSHTLQSRGFSVSGSVIRLQAIGLLGVVGAIFIAYIYR